MGGGVGGGGAGTGDEDCETCPREIICIEWTACLNQDVWDGIERNCRQCMVVPRGAGQIIDGMAVNPICNTFTSGQQGNSDGCANGGRYRLIGTPVDCNLAGSHGKPTCGGGHRECMRMGCNAGKWEDVYDPGEWKSENWDVQCGKQPRAIDGCCGDMDEQESLWYTGIYTCQSCGACRASTSSCVQCDGCNDPVQDPPNDCPNHTYSECAEVCMWFRANNTVGLDCLDPTNPQQLDRDWMCGGSCDLLCTTPQAVQPGCPSYYVCDCIENQIKDPDDYCCPGGRRGVRDPYSGQWECPDNPVPSCPGTLIGGAFANGYSQCFCERLRCGEIGAGFINNDEDKMEGMEKVLLGGECIWMMDPPENLQRCDM